MLVRFDPFRELDSLSGLLARQALGTRPQSVPMDAFRDGDVLVVRFDLPGVDPEDIDVTVEKNELTVRAERRWEPTESQEILVAERPQGVFTRQLILGDNLDTEGLRASYEAGVLSITIPVAERAKPRKVAVVAATPEGGTAIEPGDGSSRDGEPADAEPADTPSEPVPAG